jgi:hypothetical protein
MYMAVYGGGTLINSKYSNLWTVDCKLWAIFDQNFKNGR